MRLIDADKLRKHERDVKDGNTTWLMDVYLPEEIEKAPTVEECEDCISRDAAIKSECESCDRLNCGYRNSGKDYASCDIVDRLKILPPVTPTAEWIPVSERLPEEKQSVLVWCPQYKNIYCAYLEKEQWWIFGAFVQIVSNEVIAWMPLPEPYCEK